jgi:hypothetical protein
MEVAYPDHTVEEAVAALLGRIVPALSPEAVYLFGSRARRDARQDSDFDLLVIVPDETPRDRIRLTSTYRLSRGTHTALLLYCSAVLLYARYPSRVRSDCAGALGSEDRERGDDGEPQGDAADQFLDRRAHGFLRPHPNWRVNRCAGAVCELDHKTLNFLPRTSRKVE